MRALVMLLLMTAPALANAPGCYEQNAIGDRFIFTNDSSALIYQPIIGKLDQCSYGIDGNTGDPTIICGKSKINSTIIAAPDHQVTILGQLWSYFCPVQSSQFASDGL